MSEKTTIICSNCGEVKETRSKGQSFDKFYKCTHFKGEAGLYRDSGHYPLCRGCVRQMSSNKDGQINVDKFKKVLKSFNRPFIRRLYEKALLSKKDTIGQYFTSLGNRKYQPMTWKDSDELGNDKTSKIDKLVETTEEVEKVDVGKNNVFNDIKNIDLEELKDKYGYGYKDEEYFLFEKKYRELKPSFTLVTTMHIECLKEYCVNKVKEGLAKASGNLKEAKEWATMAKDVANSGKLNPSQMSKADLTNGMDTFGQLSRMVEEHDKGELVGLLPKFVERPKDRVDVTLWMYINNVRDMKGYPQCEYKEIYDFYESRKEDYESQMIDNDFLNVGDDNNGGV